MKGYSIRLNKIDQEEAFKELALEFGGTLEEGNTLIRFSGEMGRGQIKKWHLDAGLYVRVWELNLLKPLVLLKEAAPLYITENGFSLLCMHTPETIELKSINQHQQFNKIRDRRLALVPDAVNVELHLTAHLQVQFIDFTISSYWLKQQPGYANVARYINDGVLDDKGMPVLIANYPSKGAQLLSNLVEGVNKKNDACDLELPASTLIKDFMAAVAKEETEKTGSNVDLYYDKIKEAEAILLAHLQDSPPRMSVIAKTVALSESTLKRYFKIIYGKSVYEYYLNRKMELARTLLLQKPYSVNEIAEKMGYEKVSHFIEIFKKHHGCSPGSIKKRGEVDVS